MTSPHPAMTRILDVIEALQDRPFRTNFLLLGEPGTGKEGLARALAHLCCSGQPLARFDVSGFPDEEALAILRGSRGRGGVAHAADGGFLLIEEAAGLGPRLQAALLRLMKTGRCDDLPTPLNGSEDGTPGTREVAGRRLSVNVIAMSDRDLAAEVAAGRFRHDLYYRIARVVLTLPPLRERIEDLGAAAIWMGNRIMRSAGLPLEVRAAAELDSAPPQERARAIALEATAVSALQSHSWPGNFRELETVLERALLVYRKANRVGAAEIAAALGTSASSLAD